MRSPRSGAECPTGAHARNTGGKKGRSGRKPDEFKLELQKLAGSDQTLARVQEILNDPQHPAFLGALKWATEHGYGKAPQPVEHAGEGGGPVVVEVIYSHE